MTALHYAAKHGRLLVAEQLLKAGANVQAANTAGATPLLAAAAKGHPEVMKVLIKAGTDLNSRLSDGSTPLCMAALAGHVRSVMVLLRAKADPLLPQTCQSSGDVDYFPLTAAVDQGHPSVVREMLQQLGIEGGCGDARGGEVALTVAAGNQDVDIMAMLAAAGAVDTGAALFRSVVHGRERSVRFLLEQHRGKSALRAYVNTRDGSNHTALSLAIIACFPSSHRIARMLVDAGVDSASAIGGVDETMGLDSTTTPLGLAEFSLRLLEKGNGGDEVSEEKLHTLQAMRRLLMQVEAAHASSWLWHSSSSPSIGSANAAGTSASLQRMVPILGRRACACAARPRVLLAGLWR